MLVSDNNVGGRHSIETRKKISEALKGRKHYPETIELLREISKHKPGISEHLNRIRKLRKDYSVTPETRAKIKAANTGRKQTEEHRNKITASKIGRKRCPIKTALRAKKRIKPLINRETGETYYSVKEAAEKLGIKTNTLYGAIHAETQGFYKNKYNICYA